MPRGGGRGRGGKHNKKGKNNDSSKRELIYKGDGEEYAKVLKLLGSGRMEVFCFDGKTRIAKIRGKFKRRIWINLGDIVLVSVREFQDNKADIIHKYFTNEARTLKNSGELPDDVQIDDNTKKEKEDDLNIEFSDNEDNNESSSDDGNKEKINPADLNYDSSDEEDESSEDEEEKNKKFFEKQNINKKKQESDDEDSSEKDDLADI